MNALRLSLSLLTWSLCSAAPSAWAAPLGDDADARAERASVREDRAGASQQLLARAAADPSRTLWDVTVGVAYTDSEDGSHTINAPFELAARWSNSPFKVRLYGDGPARVSGAGNSASGLADVTLMGSYTHALSSGKVSFAAGMTLPTHGDVGGKHVKPRASLTWAPDVGEGLSLRMAVGAVRVGGDLPEGQSRIGKSLTATFGSAVAWGPFNTAMVQAIRTQRTGAGGFTSVVGALDAPLSNETGITVIVARGLTRGARDTTLELDWSRSF